MKEIEWIGGDDSSNRSGDVIFLHGLNGDARKTWTASKEKEEVFWPFWLAEDVPGIAVRALSYDAAPSAWTGNSMDLNDRAVNLLWLLKTHKMGDRPLCFIAHSMGGLIVKSMLRAAETSATEYSDFNDNTRGIIFFDTPHQGAKLASVLSNFSLFRKTVAIENLREHDPQLRELNKWYQGYVSRKEIKNLVFFSTRTTWLQRIVSATSADPNLPGPRPIPLDTDHGNICKLISRDQTAYKSVFDFVTKALHSNPRISQLSTQDAPLEPKFVLHDFHSYPEDIHGLPREGPLYPEDLRDAVELTMAFTVASSSPKAIRIQSVNLRVEQYAPSHLFTFPAYERGGNGITPVIGWTEVKAEIGTYPVRTNAKWNVGKGLNPADFHVRAFSKSGNTFKIAIEIDWMDLDKQEELHHFTFPQEFTVEMPKLTKWEDVVKKARKLRIFSNEAYFLLTDLREMQIKAQITTVVPTLENHRDSLTNRIFSEGIEDGLNSSTAQAPVDGLSELRRLVGMYGMSMQEGQPRSFIIADENLLLIENESRDELAEGIEDRDRIAKVIELFDSLSQKFMRPSNDHIE